MSHISLMRVCWFSPAGCVVLMCACVSSDKGRGLSTGVAACGFNFRLLPNERQSVSAEDTALPMKHHYRQRGEK